MSCRPLLAAAWLALLSAGLEGQQALGGSGWPSPLRLPAAAAQPTLNIDSLGPAAFTARQLCSSRDAGLGVVERTIGEAHADMLAGRLTCSGLVGAYLQRIAALDQRTQLNSIREVHPVAAELAVRLDWHLAEARQVGGPPLPPLFCVPVLVKDNIDVEGLATTAGEEGSDGVCVWGGGGTGAPCPFTKQHSDSFALQAASAWMTIFHGGMPT